MELADYVRILRAHWVAIVLFTALGTGGASGWVLLQTPVYTANATGTIRPATSVDQASTAMMYESLAKSQVKSYVEWGQSRSVAEHAIASLGLDTSPEALVGRISISNPADTPVLRVTATAPEPGAARDLATAWLEGLAIEGTLAADGSMQQGMLLQLVVTESAVLPSTPSSPNVRLALALGALVGLALGVAFAVVKSVLDKRIRSAEQIQRLFGHSVLGAVPNERRMDDETRIVLDGAGGQSHEQGRAATESFREIRTNLKYMGVDDPPRVIVVTSSLPGDGKSTTTANLAIAIAASGQRVVVVDGDLRRPTIASTFNVLEDVGLTDVLIGQAELDAAIQPWGPSGLLHVLGAGSIPPNPSELLASRAMQILLTELSAHAMVLIDAPPLLPVTDAAELAAQVDGAIVVASYGSTTTDVLGKAFQNLEQVHARVLGVILNRMPRRGLDSGYYGRGYDGYYSGARNPDAVAHVPAPGMPSAPGRRDTRLSESEPANAP